MAGRTLADAESDYTAVRAAWLKSLSAEQTDTDGQSIRRSKSQELYQQMLALDAEVKKLSRGGFRTRGGTPV